MARDVIHEGVTNYRNIIKRILSARLKGTGSVPQQEIEEFMIADNAGITRYVEARQNS